MRTHWMTALVLIAVTSSVQPVTADDKAGELGGDPEQLFKKLDADGDGQLTMDESPEGNRGLFKRLVKTADKDGNGRLSLDEFRAGLKSQRPERELERKGEGGGRPDGAGGMFKRLDANGDGKVEKGEVPEPMQGLFARLLEHADKDQDGSISSDEFGRVRPGLAEKLGQAFRPNPGQMFKHLDANGDGKVEKGEVPEEHREGFGKLLQHGDRNEDGALSHDEFIAAFPKGDGGRPDGRKERRPDERLEGRGGDRRGPDDKRGMFGVMPVLKALDANGDGELSTEEIAGASSALRKLDKNEDGKLTRDEMLPGGGRPEFAGERFQGGQLLERVRQMDKDGDGKIGKVEAQERLLGQFGRIDANGDGQLDKTELQQFLGEAAKRFRDGGDRGRGEGGRGEGDDLRERLRQMQERLERLERMQKRGEREDERPFDKRRGEDRKERGSDERKVEERKSD